MFTFLLSLIVVALAFVGGFYAGIKNSQSKKVEKGLDIIKALKSKD